MQFVSRKQQQQQNNHPNEQNRTHTKQTKNKNKNKETRKTNEQQQPSNQTNRTTSVNRRTQKRNNWHSRLQNEVQQHQTERVRVSDWLFACRNADNNREERLFASVREGIHVTSLEGMTGECRWRKKNVIGRFDVFADIHLYLAPSLLLAFISDLTRRVGSGGVCLRVKPIYVFLSMARGKEREVCVCVCVGGGRFVSVGWGGGRGRLEYGRTVTGKN